MNAAASSLERRTLIATVAIALLLGFFAMNDVPIGVFQDDGHYLILARALVQGDGYHYVNLPGAPAATHFPPGYPLLLAPFVWMAPRFPASVAWLKLINVALLPLVVIAIRAFARRVGGLSVLPASALAIVSVATVPVLFLSGLLFSEIAFIAALCGVLIIAEQLAARTGAANYRAALAVGLAIGALSLLRTVGVTVLPAALAVLCLRRRWTDAALVLAGALVLLLPWQWWSSAHARAVPAAVAGAYGAYGTWLLDAWREGGAAFARGVFVENVRGMRMAMMLFGLYDAPVWVRTLAFTGLTTLANAGAVHLWPRAQVSVLLLVPYGALLLVWPFPPDRFLWPLWPVVLVFLVAGTTSLGAASSPAGVRRTVRVVGAALGACLVVWHIRSWPGRSWEDLARANARVGLAAAAVAVGLPSDGLVASDQDAMVYLYANRQAVPLIALTAIQHVRPRTDAEVAAQIAGVLDAYHPRWVLVVQRESLRGAQLLGKQGRLTLRGADAAGVLVYDVVR